MRVTCPPTVEATIIYLGGALLRRSSDQPNAPRAGAAAKDAAAFSSVLLQVGFTRRQVAMPPRGLLHHGSTLACALLAEGPSAVRFCGTILRLAPTGRYPAPCPVEPGLSSRGSLRRRLSVKLLSVSYSISRPARLCNAILLPIGRIAVTGIGTAPWKSAKRIRRYPIRPPMPARPAGLRQRLS